MDPSLLFAKEKPLKEKLKTQKPIDKWVAIDKVQHFSYSCLVSLGVQYVLVNKFKLDEELALPYSSLMSFSAGTLKELNDKRSKNGYFSIKDMVANGFGVFFAGIVISMHPV